MKKLLLGSVFTLLACVSTPAFADGFAAIAATTNYAKDHNALAWVLGGMASMESARIEAKNRCLEIGRGQCGIVIAESSSWYFSGGFCNGKAYVGASKYNYATSDQIVRNKASWDNNYDCEISARFDHGVTTLNLYPEN